MSEISNCNVFTNDAVSVGSDLLQQAFQQVVDDEDRENEFVAFLQNDDIDSQTIHLTPEQALALGLTFEVNPTEEVMYQQCPDNAVTDISASLTVNNNIKSQKQDSLSSQQPITIAQINFANNEMRKSTTSTDSSSVMKDDCIDFQEWHVEKLPQNERLEKQMLGTELSLDEISLCNENRNSQQQMTTEQQNNCIQQNSTTLLMEPKIRTIKVDGHGKGLNRNDISVQEVLAQDDRLNNITDSQAQILQKLPMILPSSPQFIIKPAQTILKPSKNMKVLQGSNKFTNATINTIPSINGNATANPVLFSKATILNTLSPQIIKATPITTQLINSSGISTQFLNTSQILTGNCDISNHVSTSHISGTVINTTSGSGQNLVTQQIRLAPVVKASQSSLQRGNVQQLLTPLIKNSATVISKPSQVINNNNLSTIPSQLLKSVQVPGQILRTSATSVGKKLSGVPKTSINSNSPVVIRTASIIKTPDLKTVTTNPTSILKPTQISSTPVSILKPQMKITLNNASKQNLIVNSQNISNSINTLSNASQKIPVTQQNDTFETITNKTIQNDSVKQKLNFAANGTYLKVNKKSKNVSTQPATIITESTDTSKPLGSSENPIQIVQQGQTFHSMQRLSQTQLKQIAQVLQQRNQEAAISNERVVYRVVFPEELDLRIRSPGNMLKNRGAKRGRPKKNVIRPSVFPPKPSSSTVPLPPSAPPQPSVADDEQEEVKDERKKIVARTRSGRLSRPPRHMVRDYKHLHHLDFLQPDLDDSDGGYSDYNTNNDKLEDEECPKELLTGLEVPKRKISDHFRCPTCNKIYLGRSRMARHFETHPDHGSPEQLPPPTREPELKQNNNQDPLKRKGKRRGPWAYVTPEAKSERRQVKLKEALAVCEDVEIIKIATKPVLNAQSLYDLLMLKSDYNVNNFLNELKTLMVKIREKTSIMLTIVNNNEKQSKDVIQINEELLCDALGINPGLYRMNNEALRNIELPILSNYQNNVTGQPPPAKIQKTNNIEDTKENNEEQMSSGFSESSDVSVSDFLNERRNDIINNPTCPEVLSALTLMRKNPSPVNNADNNKLNNVSKLLISNPEIQSQISDNPGFQKVDISTSKVTNFEKSHKEGFIKLVDSVGLPSCAQIFCKMENKYEQSKLDRIEQSFIKLEPVDQGFVKLENGTAVGAYQKQENLEKIRNGLDNVETGSQSFTKGFQRLVSKIVPMTSAESSLNCIKTQSSSLETESCKVMPSTSVCKISDSIPMLQESVPIISNNCDGNIFENTDNLDMSKMTQYDHIAHLDILNTSGVIDKNLLIDEKLVEQLHLVDQSNLVDELVSERLKNIIPDNILENNLISNNANLDTDLDFEVLREEFGNNTRS